MSFGKLNIDDSCHPEITPETKLASDFTSKLFSASHTKNRKSSLKDFQIKELLVNSKFGDYVPEFAPDNALTRDHQQIFDQVCLSRISMKPSEEIDNRSANHCYELIAREYEFAFDRIEVALHQKEA